MVKHLVSLHGSPLTLRVGRHTLYTSAVLLPLLLRVEEVPIDLLHAECPRDVADDCKSRHPEVAGKGGPQHVHELLSLLLMFAPNALHAFDRLEVLVDRGATYSGNGAFAKRSAKFGAVNPSTYRMPKSRRILSKLVAG